MLKVKDKILVISNQKEYEFINIDTIFYLQSGSCYTNIFYDDGRKIMVTKNLGYFEKRLPGDFLRIHHSTIVNMNSVSKYRNNSDEIVLTNNIKLKTSRKGKKKLTEYLKKLG